MVVIEVDLVQRLYSRSGYFDRFYEILYETDYSTYREVWNILEKEYEVIFGQPRYTSYQSFKNAKNKETKSRQTKQKVTKSYS